MNITMSKAILFIFSGLPAVGKSTLARFLVKEFGAVYLRIDTIEQGLKDLRQFGIRKFSKKLVISLLFCNFIVENQSLTKHI